MQLVGYLGIILEEEVAFNKAGVALVMAVALWVIRGEAAGPEVGPSRHLLPSRSCRFRPRMRRRRCSANECPIAAQVDEVLREKLAEVAEVVFFLVGAMTIVETVDAHQGFKIITDAIKTRSKASNGFCRPRFGACRP